MLSCPWNTAQLPHWKEGHCHKSQGWECHWRTCRTGGKSLGLGRPAKLLVVVEFSIWNTWSPSGSGHSTPVTSSPVGSGVKTGGGGGRAASGAWVGWTATGSVWRARAKPRPLCKRDGWSLDMEVMWSTWMMGVVLGQLAHSRKQLAAFSTPFQQSVQDVFQNHIFCKHQDWGFFSSHYLTTNSASKIAAVLGMPHKKSTVGVSSPERWQSRWEGEWEQPSWQENGQKYLPTYSLCPAAPATINWPPCGCPVLPTSALLSTNWLPDTSLYRPHADWPQVVVWSSATYLLTDKMTVATLDSSPERAGGKVSLQL